MTTKRKNVPYLGDANKIAERQEKAVAHAREHLKSKGIEYPIYDANESPEENYGRQLAYAEQEAALVVQFMRQPSGPRPLVLDTTNQKDEWRQYND